MNQAQRLAGRPVLIAEDEMFIAQDIAHEIEQAGGEVLGPVSTVEDALALLDASEVAGAVLDVNLLDGDITPVLVQLVKSGAAVVVNTGAARPWNAEQDFPDVPVFSKPTDPTALTGALADQVARAA